MADAARLLAMLQELHGRCHAVTAAPRAREAGASERAIDRDLSDLAARGAPAEREVGVGSILRPRLCLAPLMTTGDETDAVLLGLCYIDQCGDAGLTKTAGSARAEITALSRRRCR